VDGEEIRPVSTLVADPSSLGEEGIMISLRDSEIKSRQFDIVDTTQEDGSHGDLEAQKSTLHTRETSV